MRLNIESGYPYEGSEKEANVSQLKDDQLKLIADVTILYRIDKKVRELEDKITKAKIGGREKELEELKAQLLKIQELGKEKSRFGTKLTEDIIRRVREEVANLEREARKINREESEKKHRNVKLVQPILDQNTLTIWKSGFQREEDMELLNIMFYPRDIEVLNAIKRSTQFTGFKPDWEKQEGFATRVLNLYNALKEKIKEKKSSGELTIEDVEKITEAEEDRIRLLQFLHGIKNEDVNRAVAEDYLNLKKENIGEMIKKEKEFEEEIRLTPEKIEREVKKAEEEKKRLWARIKTQSFGEATENMRRILFIEEWIRRLKNTKPEKELTFEEKLQRIDDEYINNLEMAPEEYLQKVNALTQEHSEEERNRLGRVLLADAKKIRDIASKMPRDSYERKELYEEVERIQRLLREIIGAEK